MFALIRHAAYDIGSGSITPKGVEDTRALANFLRSAGVVWREVRTSPTSRTQETANILGAELGLPVEIDERISMDGNYVDLLPPTEPTDIIFVSHLPVLTQMLRAWSKAFSREEPPLTHEGCGYLVDPPKRTIDEVCP